MMTRFMQQIITGVSSLAVALSPILAVPSFGQGINGAGANAPEVLRSANNTPLVMIETPNGAGVSHNTYDSFDIDGRGAILNNIDANYGRTQLGGYVQGNGNLSNGPASVIINEVITNNPSELGGYLEVGGTRADVVIANPYGITCDGCGFINTDRATVTTGLPRLAPDGALNSIDVSQGNVKIGERGLDATGVSQFDLLSRTVEFAGAIYGQNVRIVAGRNNVIYATGAVEVKGDDGGEAPAIAIDSTVLGGMYAGKITINSTERGAGVRAPETMAANAGEMHITADGRLVMGQASAKRVVVQSRNSDVEIRKQIAAAEQAEVQAARDLVIAANGRLVSESALSVTTGRDVVLENGAVAGSEQGAVKLDAGGATRLGAGAQLVATTDLSLQSRELRLGSTALVAGGKATVTVDALALNGGAVQATDDLNLGSTTAQVDNATIRSGGNLRFAAQTLTGQAHNITATGTLNLTAKTITLGDGRVVAGDNAVLRADRLAIGGVIGSQSGALEIATAAGDLSATGTLSAAKDIRLNSAGTATLGHVQAGEALKITAAGDVTGLDAFTSTGMLEITTGGSLRGLALHAGEDVITKATGDILIGDNPEVAGRLLPHQVGEGEDGGNMPAPETNTGKDTDTDIGDTSAAPPSIAAANDGGDDFSITPGLRIGDVRAGRDIDLTAGGRIVIGNTAVAERNISLDAGKLIDISAIQLGGALSMQSGTGDSRIGRLVVTGDFALDVDGKLALDQVAAPGSLTLSAGSIALGGAAAGTDLVLTAETGDLLAKGDLLASRQITLDAAGSIEAEQIIAKAAVDIDAGADFTTQTVRSDSTIRIDAGGKLTSTGAIDADQGVILISGGQLSGTAVQALQGAVTIDAGGDVTLTDALISDATTDLASGGTATLNNLQAGAGLTLTTAQDLRLNGNLAAGGIITANIGGAFDVAAANAADLGKLLVGGKAVTLSAKSLRLGDYAQLSSQTQNITLDIAETAELDRQARIISADDLNITGGALAMTSGAVVAADGDADIQLDRLNIADSLLQTKGDLRLRSGATAIARSDLRAGGDLSLSATQLTGQDYLLTAVGALNLTADRIAFAGGQIAAGQDVKIRAGGLDIQDAITSQTGGVSLTTDQADLVATGTIKAAEDIFVTSADIARLGHVQAGKALSITATGDVTGLDAFESVDVMTITSGGTLRGLALHSGTDLIAHATDDILIGDDPKTVGMALPHQLAAAGSGTATETDAQDQPSSQTQSPNKNTTPEQGNTAGIPATQTVPGLPDASDGNDTDTALAHLRIGDVRAGRDLELSAGGRVLIANTAIATRDVTLKAGALADIATLRLGGNLSFESVSGAARIGQLVAAGDVTAKTAGDVTAKVVSAGGDVTLSGGRLDLGGLVSGSDVLLTSSQSDLMLGGDLSAQGSVDLDAARALSATRIVAGKKVEITAGSAFDALVVQSGDALTIGAGNDLTVSQLINAGSNVTLNSGGQIKGTVVQAASGAISVNAAGNAQISEAVLSGAGTKIISRSGTVTLKNLQSGAGLVLDAAKDIRLTGNATAAGSASLTAGGAFTVAGSAAADQGHNLIAQNAIFVSAASVALGNYAQLASRTGDVSLKTTGANTLGLGATIVAAKALTVAGSNLILGQNAALQGQKVNLGLGQSVKLENGTQIIGDDLVKLTAQDLTLAPTALISQRNASGTTMEIRLSGNLSNTGGVIQSAGALTVTAAKTTLSAAGERRAAILAEGPLTLTTDRLVAGASDLLQSNTGDLVLRGKSGALDVTGGLLRAAKTIDINAGRVAVQNSDLGAGTALTLNATSGSLTFNGRANAGSIAMTADKGNANIAGQLASSGAITLAATAGDLTHSSSVTTPKTLTLLAGKTLADSGRGVLPAGADQNVAHLGALTLTGGSVKAGGDYLVRGNANITAKIGGVTTSSRIAAGALLKVVAATAMLNTGTLNAAQLEINAGNIDNRGSLTGTAALALTATGQGITNSGAVTAGNTLALNAKGAIANKVGGDISAHDGQTTIKAASLSNAGTLGLLEADLDLAGDLSNSGTLSANTTGTIGGTLINTGTIQGGNHTLILANLENSGNFRTDGSITLTMSGSDIDNRGLLHGGQGVTINNADRIRNFGGAELSGDSLNLNGKSLDNAGEIIAKGRSQIILSGALTNSGTIQNGVSAQPSEITAATITNSGDIISDQGALIVTATKSFANTGKLSGRGANSYLAIHADTLPDLGQVAAEGTLELANVTGGLLEQLNTKKGEEIVTDGALYIKAKEITNAGGIAGLGGLTLEGNTLTNTGTIYSEADMALRFRDLIDNDGGTILAVNGALIVEGREKNADGSYKALDHLINQNGGRIETLFGQGANFDPSDDIPDTNVDMSFNVGILENLRRIEEFVSDNFNDIPQGRVSNDNSWAFCSDVNVGCDYYRNQAEGTGVLNIQFRIKSEMVSVKFADNEAQILSAGDILFEGGEVVNEHSLISAVKDITFDVDSVTNIGTETGERVNFVLTYVGYPDQIANAFGYTGGPNDDRSDPALYDPKGGLLGRVLDEKNGISRNENTKVRVFFADSDKVIQHRYYGSLDLREFSGFVATPGENYAGYIDGNYYFTRADWSNFSVPVGFINPKAEYGTIQALNKINGIAGDRIDNKSFSEGRVHRPGEEKDDYFVHAAANTRASSTGGALIGGGTVVTASMLSFTPDGAGLGNGGAAAKDVAGATAQGLTGRSGLNLSGPKNGSGQITGPSGPAGGALPGQTGTTFFGRIAKNIASRNEAINFAASNQALVAQNGPNTPALTVNAFVNLGAIGNDNLFVVNQNPNSNYLVETRHKFIDQNNFLSSDYFLDSLNFDPEGTQMRLGDAMVETWLIRDQLFAQTGRNLLVGQGSEYDQLRGMYDNAAAQAKALGLVPGVSLTADQVGALTKDIVWLEEHTISGRKVLIPRVYLTEKTIRENAKAAAFIGGDQGTNLKTGRLVNIGGAIGSAQGQTVITSDSDIQNDYGLIFGGKNSAPNADGLKLPSVVLNAKGNYTSTSGLVTGEDIVINATDILVNTEVKRLKVGNNGNYADAAGPIAGIRGTGNIGLNAIRDIKLTGVDLDAGGDVTAIAGGDIELGAIKLETKLGDQIGKNYSYLEVTKYRTSDITAGGNVALISTGTAAGADGRANVILQGSDVNAGGTIGIAAQKGDVQLLAVADEFYSDRARSSSSWGGLKKKTYRDRVYDLTNNTVALNGEAIDIYADGDVLAEGTQFTAGGLTGEDAVESGNLRITSKTGKIDFKAVENIHAEKHEKSSKLFGGLFSSDSTRENVLSDMQGAKVTTTGDMDLSAVQGSVLFQGGDYTGVGGKVNVDAQTTYLQGTIDSQYSFEHSNDNNGFVITDKTRVTVKETAEAPLFNQDALSINGDIHAGGRDGSPQFARGNTIEALGPQGVLAAQNATESPVEGGSDGSDPHWTKGFTDQYGSDAQTRLVALTDLKGPGTEYLQNLDAIATGEVTYGAKAELLDVQYKEVTQQTGVLTKLAVALITQNPWAAFAINTAADAVVSGEIDLENVAKDAAFTYVTAGVGEFGGKDSFKGVSGWAKNKLNVPLVYDPITGARTVDYFSETALQHAAIDATTNAVTQTAVYGGSFSENLTQSYENAVIDEATANVQNYVGDNKGPEGSPLGVIGHGVAGCVSSDLKGGNCGQGAVNAAASEIATAWADNAYDHDSDKVKDLIGNTVNPILAAVTSGGNLGQFSANQGITASQLQNNYLTHEQRDAFDKLLEDKRKARCVVPYDTGSCRPDIAAEIEINKQLDQLRELSNQNTMNLMATCSSGARNECAAGLAKLNEHNEWAAGLFNRRGSASVGGDALIEGDYASWLNLDTTLEKYYDRVASGEFDPATANEKIARELVRKNGAFEVVEGTLTIGGVGVCAVASGGACLIAAAGATIGAVNTADGLAEVVTGKAQLNTVEQLALTAGMSADQAKDFWRDVEFGAALITVVNGVAVVKLKNADNIWAARIATKGGVPSGYTKNADGSYTGPNGGIARDTGHVDTNGSIILRRDSGGYYTVDANGKQVSAPSPYTSNVPQIHHVCTNKNCTGTANGGPWTPRFQEFFDNAGLNINREINEIEVPGHKGPHPAEYHQYVFGRLDRATTGLTPNTPSYTNTVENVLNDIKTEAVTPGNQVNNWLTRK